MEKASLEMSGNALFACTPSKTLASLLIPYLTLPIPFTYPFEFSIFLGNADFGYLGPLFECLYMEVSCNLTPFNSQMR